VRQTLLQHLVYVVIAATSLITSASGAINNGDLINISRPGSAYGSATDSAGYADTDKAYGGALLGGEFRIVGKINGGTSGQNNGTPASDAEVFKTFCLEYQEHITIPTNYFATIGDRAMGGGVDSESPQQPGDPLSTATKWFYSNYRNGTLKSATGNLFNYDTPDWSDALQLVFWRLEEEVLPKSGSDPTAWKLSDPNGGSISGIGTGSNKNYANQLWTFYENNQSSIDNATGVDIGRVKVINLWTTYSNGIASGPSQSQLYYGPPPAPTAPVPEPGMLAIWAMGLGIAGLVRARRWQRVD